ncbi:MAG: AAA family ATPase [Saprospiraceae bacterium]|nr:AAA family ATPase [Saprospiraceae bacterium]
MNKNDLKILQEAILRAPDNIALRLSYALKLFKIKEYDESEKNYHHVLKLDPENIKAKQGLIELYFAKGNYSAVIVIAEELSARNLTSEKILELQVKALLRQNSLTEAQELYNKILERNPFYFDEELDSVLNDQEEYFDENREGEQGYTEKDDFDPFDDFSPMDMPDFISNPEQLLLPRSEPGFGAMAGQDYVKQALQNLYIHLDLDGDTITRFDIKPTGSILLYGPPGCGKTFAVTHMPYEFDIDIIPFDWNRVSNNQSISREFIIPFYFNMARLQMPCTIFIDQVDQLIGPLSHEEQNRYLGQMLLEIDAMYRYNQNIMLIGATNAVWDINPALLRHGRFDNALFVYPPDEADRQIFIETRLNRYNVKYISCDELVEKSSLFSFSDLEKLFDIAIKRHLSKHLNKSSHKLPDLEYPIIAETLNTSKPSTLYWFDKIITSTNASFKMTEIYDEVNAYISRQKG